MPPSILSKYICTCGNDWPCRHARIDTTTFNFLALPGEIRNQIYGLLLTPPLNEQARGRNDTILISPLGNGVGSITPYEPPHSIFGVCKSIRDEARSLYYALHRRFDFIVTAAAEGIPLESDKRGYRRWIQLLGDDVASQLLEIGLTYRLCVVRRGGWFTLEQTPENTFLNGFYHIRIGLQLDVIPPGMNVVLETRGNIRSSFRTKTQAMLCLKRTLEVRLKGLFGCGHPGVYRCEDLVDCVDAWFDSIESCFSEERTHRYWLRRRKGREEVENEG